MTGRGNIVESVKHSRDMSEEIMEKYLDWHQEDYEKWHKQTAVNVQKDISKIVEAIERQKYMSDDAIKLILDRTKALQHKVGFDGEYKNWVAQNTPPRLENML